MMSDPLAESVCGRNLWITFSTDLWTANASPLGNVIDIRDMKDGQNRKTLETIPADYEHLTRFEDTLAG